LQFFISYVNSLERFSSIQSRLQCLPVQYSYIHTTYTVNSFGKAFAHVRNRLLKKTHMAQTKMTQKGGFSKLCVKIKKNMLYRPTPFFNTYGRIVYEKKKNEDLKAYRLSELNFFVYIKSCQYSMFYTIKMF
jgi:hypothetical protein